MGRVITDMDYTDDTEFIAYTIGNSGLSPLLQRGVLKDYLRGLHGLATATDVHQHVEGILSGDRHWWVLDAKGNPVDPVTFGARPADGFPDNGDPYTPYYHVASHLHGEKACEGIHVLGSLDQARAELIMAQRGESNLPWGDEIE